MLRLSDETENERDLGLRYVVQAGPLRGLGLDDAAARLAQPDAALLQANSARVAQARQLMRELGAQGVPSFVLERDGQRQLLNASTAFSNPEAFVAQWLAA